MTAITFSTTGSAVATGFDLIVVTATVDGATGNWGLAPSTAPEPAIEATTLPVAAPAEPVIPARTVTPMSSAPTEASISPPEPAPTTEP
ncbi:hypothetical protein [Amycolatopsis kentuckyensis]|uniref:hypothetical protein n=1 Tax=Amycolatopsis kentuckyensis TaxID=218823 RepID=UPI001177FC2F|nr:hypothetical protein [Amycolatopsis kentuckyensis]